MSETGLKEIAAYADAIGPHKSMVVQFPVAQARDTGLARRARAAGLGIHVWTLRAENEFLPPDLRSAGDAAARGDLRREINALLDAGITGMFADQPDLAVARDATSGGAASSHASTIPSRHTGTFPERGARLLWRAARLCGRAQQRRLGGLRFLRPPAGRASRSRPASRTCITTRWTATTCRCRISAWCWSGTPGRRSLSACGRRAPLRHRAGHPLRGPGRRAGDDVPVRPVRQCARIQGVQGSCAAVCEVATARARCAAGRGSPAWPSRRSRIFAGDARRSRSSSLRSSARAAAEQRAGERAPTRQRIRGVVFQPAQRPRQFDLLAGEIGAEGIFGEQASAPLRGERLFEARAACCDAAMPECDIPSRSCWHASRPPAARPGSANRRCRSLRRCIRRRCVHAGRRCRTR